jgi:cation transport ATPase
MKRLVILIVVSILGMNFSSAQLEIVNQEVFGMDCAPCAYGLERGLKKMHGLDEVRVSLNDGKAYLELSEKNELELRQIQQEVKNNGFSAKKAEVVLKGELVEKDDDFVIVVGNEEYIIQESTEESIRNSLETGEIKVRGIVQDKEDSELTNSWQIQLTEIL